MDFRDEAMDITDEFEGWPLKDFIKLLTYLEKSGFNKTYFDGNDAALYLVRPRKCISPEQETGNFICSANFIYKPPENCEPLPCECKFKEVSREELEKMKKMEEHVNTPRPK